VDKYYLGKNDRPSFNPKKVIFKSHYDQFGRVAENKSKELSRASLSSDSDVSRGGVSRNYSNGGQGFAMGRLGVSSYNKIESCNIGGVIEEEKQDESYRSSEKNKKPIEE